MIELLMNLAQSKAGTLARMTGKSESEIKSAIEQSKQYLPDIKNSKDGGVSLARSLGIDKNFAEEMYRRYGHHANRIPGIGKALLDKEYNKLLANLEPSRGGNRQQRRISEKRQGGFDRQKYKKL